MTDRAEALRHIGLDYGGVVKVPVPGKPLYLVTHPEFARHVLQRNNKNYRRSFDYRIVRSLLGDGLITTHDEFWRHARRAVTPCFGREKIRALTESIIGEVDRFEQDRLSGHAPVLAGATMSSLSLRMFARSMLSRDVSPDESEILGTVSVALRHLDRRLVAPIDIDAYLPTISGIRFRRARRRFDEIMHRWIEERLADSGDRVDLMSVLIDASAHMDDEARVTWLRDQLATYLMAGHETVSVALSWCLLLLHAHPEVQRRAQRECQEQLGEGTPAPEAFQHLRFTDAVIQEAMRLYPPVWSIGRESISADQLGAAHIPGGATVMVSPYSLHRHPDYWESPETFRPERFLESQKPTPFTYLPFSAGSRHCIGDHLSRLELRVALAMILRRFRITRPTDETIGTEALISLRPKPDFQVAFERVA
ncbi:MAG: cytochrome P450 [Myxococcota bacterium]